MSNSQFRFVVDPVETAGFREARWDGALTALQATGYTITGVGPDGDWPVLIEYPDGRTINHTSEPINGPYVEVYGTKKLGRA